MRKKITYFGFAKKKILFIVAFCAGIGVVSIWLMYPAKSHNVQGIRVPKPKNNPVFL